MALEIDALTEVTNAQLIYLQTRRPAVTTIMRVVSYSLN